MKGSVGHAENRGCRFVLKHRAPSCLSDRPDTLRTVAYPVIKEKITGFMQTIRRAVVCDTRLPDRACGPLVGDAGNSVR